MDVCVSVGWGGCVDVDVCVSVGWCGCVDVGVCVSVCLYESLATMRDIKKVFLP